jgi:hypothetical protein
MIHEGWRFDILGTKSSLHLRMPVQRRSWRLVGLYMNGMEWIGVHVLRCMGLCM